MHATQKKAIFAMIDSIENQLRYVKSLLLMEEGPEMAAGAPSKAAQAPQTAPQYLTDDEEERLQQEMEQERLAAQKADSERIQAQWAAQRIAQEELGSLALG